MAYTVWFEHREGPYSAEFVATGREELYEIYRGDPFFIGVQGPGEEPPPVVAEYQRYMAARKEHRDV